MGYKKERIKEEETKEIGELKKYDYLKWEDKPVEVFINLED